MKKPLVTLVVTVNIILLSAVVPVNPSSRVPLPSGAWLVADGPMPPPIPPPPPPKGGA
jgi:hypothetical protein